MTSLTNSNWVASLHGGSEIQGRLTRLRVGYIEAGELLNKGLLMDLREKSTRVTGKAQDNYYLRRDNLVSWTVCNTFKHAGPLIYGSAKGKLPWKGAGPRTVDINGRIYSRQYIQNSPGGPAKDNLLDPDTMRTNFIRIYRQLNKITPDKRKSLFTLSKKKG